MPLLLNKKKNFWHVLYYLVIDSDASMVLAETAEKLGQRALVGKVCIDRNGPDYYTEKTQGK